MNTNSVNSKRRTRGAYTGFTMVEILFVIALIGLLTALLIRAIGPAIEGARENATRLVISHIQTQFEDRLASFNALDFSNEAANIKAVGTTPPLSVQAIAVILRMNAYRAAFPQRIQDLYGLDGVYGTGDDAAFLSQIKQYVNVTVRPEYLPADDAEMKTFLEELTSSELMYLILEVSHPLGQETYSIDRFGSKYVADLEKPLSTKYRKGNDIPEFIDGWGNSLQFYSAPTGLFRPSGSNINLSLGARALFRSIPGDDGKASYAVDDSDSPKMLKQDPFDKQLKIPASSPARNAWQINSNVYRGNFAAGGVLTAIGGPQTAIDANNYYHPNTYFSYLIVSAGPDGDLGLGEPTATGAARLATPTGSDSVFDNVTNRQPLK